MRLLWLFSLFVVVIEAKSQDVLSKFAENKNLTDFASLVKASENFKGLLDGAEGWTLLAPTNDAVALWKSGNGTVGTQDDIDALLSYHLLNATVSMTKFGEIPLFIETYLSNSSYTNVTGGQVVKVLSENGAPGVTTGNNTVSRITNSDISVSGGLIHTIDKVLKIPQDGVTLSTQGGLNQIAKLVFTGFYKSTSDASFPAMENALPHSTYFIPATYEALKLFTDLGGFETTKGQAENLFKYHVIQGSVIYSPDLKDGMQIQSQQGTNMTVTIFPDGTRWVNGAKLVTIDHLISNGVVHTIDSLLDFNNRTVPAKPTTILNSTKTSSAAEVTDKPASEEGLATGAKAGIAIAVIAFILALCALGYFFWRRKRQTKSETATELSSFIEEPKTERLPSVELGYQMPAELPPHPQLYEMETGGERWETGSGDWRDRKDVPPTELH